MVKRVELFQMQIKNTMSNNNTNEINSNNTNEIHSNNTKASLPTQNNDKTTFQHGHNTILSTNNNNLSNTMASPTHKETTIVKPVLEVVERHAIEGVSASEQLLVTHSNLHVLQRGLVPLQLLVVMLQCWW